MTDNKFEYSNVFPGKYSLTIINKFYCFNEKTVEIQMKYQDHKTVKFVQTGFALQYNSNNDIQARIVSPKNKSTNLVF